MRAESGRNHSTHKLYTQTSPRAAHLEHDGLAPLHLTCPQGQLRSQSIADHIRELPEMRAPTLRLRQPSHEKALFRGSAVFKGTSAMPGLDSSTTMGGIHRVQDSTRTPLEEMEESSIRRDGGSGKLDPFRTKSLELSDRVKVPYLSPGRSVSFCLG